MSEDDVIAFKASFPAIKSAILISGDGNGGSIKLEIPELEIDTFRQLIDMRRDELIVTIQRAEKPKQEETQVMDWREGKRRR